MRRLSLRALSATALTAGVLALTPGSASAATPTTLYGAQLHAMWDTSTPEQMNAQLDLLRSAHADTTRVDVAWASLQESGRGQLSQWYVDRLDRLVAGAAARGIRPIVTLLDTPCWASSAPSTVKQSCSGAYWDRGTQFYAPTSNADFGWITGWVADRYGDRLAGIELWNEPNYDDGSYADLIAPDKAKAYAGMVEAAYSAAKAVAPSLPILAGSLSYSDTDFLRKLFAAGMKHFDGISVHPYNEGKAPGSSYDPAWIKADYAHGLPALHDAMTAAGYGSRGVWITEMGWSTCKAGSSSWCVTQQQQAANLASAVGYAPSWSWLRSFVAYTLRDGGTNASDREQNFGLVTASLAAKPALAALRDAIDAARRAAGSAAPTTPTPVPVTPAPSAPSTPTAPAPAANAPTSSTRVSIPRLPTGWRQEGGARKGKRVARVQIGTALRHSLATLRGHGTRSVGGRSLIA